MSSTELPKNFRILSYSLTLTLIGCLLSTSIVFSQTSTYLVAQLTSIPPTATPTPTPTPTPTDLLFEDVTEAAGVAFSGGQFGSSWGDYDNDGWLDLFANNHLQDDPHLYHNNGDGTFTDVYPGSGIFQTDPHDSSWGDYDSDGDLDLYITTGRPNINPLFENVGNNTFVERSGQAGVADVAGRGRSANWIDYDYDGDLDLFKGNGLRIDGPDRLFRNENNGTFTDVSAAAGLNDPASTIGNVWGDYDGDGDLDVFLSGGGGVRLYRNNGNGTFSNVTNQAGINSDRRSWAADFGDYDNDGDLDLYLAFRSKNQG